MKEHKFRVINGGEHSKSQPPLSTQTLKNHIFGFLEMIRPSNKFVTSLNLYQFGRPFAFGAFLVIVPFYLKANPQTVENSTIVGAIMLNLGLFMITVAVRSSLVMGVALFTLSLLTVHFGVLSGDPHTVAQKVIVASLLGICAAAFFPPKKEV